MLREIFLGARSAPPGQEGQAACLWVTLFLTNIASSFRQLQLRILGDHFFETVRHEADREFHIVAVSFRAEDRAGSVLGMFYACAHHPLTGGLSAGPPAGRGRRGP